MSEERKMILEMLKDGKINVDEAERLLDALHDDKKDGRPFMPRPPFSPRKLHITVTEDGEKRADMRVPFGIAKAGIKVGRSFTAFGGRFARDIRDVDEVFEILDTINVDEIINALDDGNIELPYTVLDVSENEDGKKVTVVLE